MRNLISAFLKLIVVIFAGAGTYFLFMNKPMVNRPDQARSIDGLTPQAALLKKHLLQYAKPQRVEVRNLTERLAQEADQVKKITVPLTDESKFYISIDLFTDEKDPTAPLIAQIQFFDVKSENKIKEESINLD